VIRAQSGPGATGATGAPAAKLFALWTEEDGIKQQSGGITATGAVFDQPFTGYRQVIVTFPQDLSNCAAIAGNSNPNGSVSGGGGIDDHALTTSIFGTTVRVYRPTSSSGVMPDFTIAVFC